MNTNHWWFHLLSFTCLPVPAHSVWPEQPAGGLLQRGKQDGTEEPLPDGLHWHGRGWLQHRCLHPEGGVWCTLLRSRSGKHCCLLAVVAFTFVSFACERSFVTLFWRNVSFFIYLIFWMKSFKCYVCLFFTLVSETLVQQKHTLNRSGKKKKNICLWLKYILHTGRVSQICNPSNSSRKLVLSMCLTCFLYSTAC